MITLVIEESKWAQGGNSLLLDDEGKMCCLGFLGKACCATDGQLKSIGSPAGTSFSVKWVPGLIDANASFNTILCQEIISTNDDPSITLEQRKEKLRPLFEKIGITLRFIK